MKLDLSFEEKISYLFGDYPKYSSMKVDISTIISSQLNSPFSYSPSHCTTFLYQNYCNPFKNHHLKGSNHHSNFSTVFPSSIGPITMIPTPSYKATHNNGSQRKSIGAQNPMMFESNNNKMKTMHGRLNTSKGVWDLSKKNIFQYGETSQPRVSQSLPPSLVYDADPSLSIKRKHQGDLSSNGGIEYKPQKNDPGLVLSDQKRQKMSQKNSEIRHKDSNTIKGQWTANENRNLVELMDSFGRNWTEIAKFMNGRNAKQCRERWYNHLRPQIKKAPWSEEEEKILIKAHKKVGNKWTEIARMLPGRTENAIKNRWNTAIRSHNRKNRKNRCNSSKNTILWKYINEINAKEVDEKENHEDLTTLEDEQPSGYEFENGMEFFVEVPIKEEMDFMEMINNSP
ncbi:unnamed protein product [Trifolium pratense]|uniref:Uncharacterized protein n=1 Tax=Trifolium pratense TaxID=57577 RepID=A0ACB0LLY2_TRIPR|nr:unnamed protein product [Trifolium pratense]